jgi:hypothetical protein
MSAAPQANEKKRRSRLSTKQDDVPWLLWRLESLFISFTAFFVFSASIRVAFVRYVRKIVPAPPSIVNSLP